MNNGIILIEKTAKQSIWTIQGTYPYYVTKKNLYLYDFAVIAIKGKDEHIRKYHNNSEHTHISIACQRNDNSYEMLIRDTFCEEMIKAEFIDSILIYFEKRSQALLAFTTAETFKEFGFFLNSVSSIDIPSLREEAMSIAYMMDDTRSVFDMFKKYKAAEEGSDINE